MSNVDINVDRRTDGRTENRTPISHPATSRCDKKAISLRFNARTSKYCDSAEEKNKTKQTKKKTVVLRKIPK